MPHSDVFITLARTEAGVSCFWVPGWLPDGSRNRIMIQRLKDKAGNKSNASSEVEFRGAYGTADRRGRARHPRGAGRVEIVGAAVVGDWGAAVGGAVEGTIVRGVVDGTSDGAVGGEVLDGATEVVSAVGVVCAAGWAWPAHALSTIPTNSARPSSDLTRSSCPKIASSLPRSMLPKFSTTTGPSAPVGHPERSKAAGLANDRRRSPPPARALVASTLGEKGLRIATAQ